MPLTFGSLFAGIGGMDLGLERAGMQCKWQVEINPYARRVLAKHWPHVKKHNDVREVGAANLANVDLIAGGFPCQDVSVGGSRSGLGATTRSGLWSEFARIIRELRPRYVLVENVPALLAPFRDDNGSVIEQAGIGRVLGDLAALGLDAEWQCLSAASAGAPHLRERVFIVAHARGLGISRHFSKALSRQPAFSWCENGRSPAEFRGRSDIPEPIVRRSGDGFSCGVERLKGLGNAVVPQVAEHVGRCIVAHAEAA